MAAANTAVAALGASGRTFLSALILVSCTGCAMSSLLTGPHVLVPMAADGLFIPWFGAVSARTGVPARAIVVSSLLAIVYVEWRSFEQLAGAFVVGAAPFYLLAVAAVYVLRRREPTLARPYRVPGYPATPAVFIAGSLALLTGALRQTDATAPFAFGMLAIGVPVRWITRRRR